MLFTRIRYGAEDGPAFWWKVALNTFPDSHICQGRQGTLKIPAVVGIDCTSCLCDTRPRIYLFEGVSKGRIVRHRHAIGHLTFISAWVM